MINQLIEKRINQLHSLRGFAAIIVVIAHAKFPFWIGGNEYVKKYPMSDWNVIDYLLFLIDMLTSNATVMVIVFFTLSGFFMAYSFDKNKWKPLDFYWNRSLRIYIPYIYSIFIAISLLLLSHYINPSLFKSNNPREYNVDIVVAYNDLGITSFLKSLLFLPNHNYIGYNYPYWSLLVEGIFYLICPLIFLRKQNWFYILSFLLIIFQFYTTYSGIKTPRFVSSIFFFYSFSCGIFTYNFFKSNFFKERVLMIFNKKNIVLDVFLILIFIILMLGGLKFEKKFFYILTAIFTPLYIARILFFQRGEYFRKYLNPILNFFGKISFSIYLIHVPFFILFYSILVKYSGHETFESRIYWIFVLLVLPFGYLSYLFVEEKSLNLIKRLRKKKQ